MKLPTPYRHRDREHLGPLIDVVFLLLIFFMLAGRITPLEPLAVDPPRSTAAASVKQSTLLILLAADGRMALDDQEVDRDALRPLLRARLAEPSGTLVDVKADARVATGEVVALLEVLREAGVRSIRLLTQQAGSRKKNP